jgi:ribose transport system ATP-binding protein
MATEQSVVQRAIEKLQIDTRAQGEVRRLSGGNQQKVTIARWIAEGVETLLCFDPTRGIDIRTKRQIYHLLRELADGGAAVLLYTSELEEVQLACDRVVVIFNGSVVAQMDAAIADEPRLMRAAYGLDPVEPDEATTPSLPRTGVAS